MAGAPRALSALPCPYDPATNFGVSGLLLVIIRPTRLRPAAVIGTRKGTRLPSSAQKRAPPEGDAPHAGQQTRSDKAASDPASYSAI